MKKFIAIITTIIALILVWACSDYEVTNPYHPDYGNIKPLNNVELEIEKIDRIKVIWDSDYLNEEEGYKFRVDRKLGASDWEIEYKLFEPEIYTFVDSFAGIDQANQYRILVTFDENISLPVAGSIFNPFPAPSDIDLSRSDIKTIHLSWSDRSNGEDGFKIDRYVNGSWTEEFSVLDQNASAWTDSNALLNDTIQYRIYAYRNTSESLPLLTDKVENLIPMPTDLTIKQNDVSTFELNWTDNCLGEEGFIIQRSIDGSAFTAIDSLNANTTTFIDPTVGKSKSLSDVSYRIMTYFDNYTSNFTEITSNIEFPAPSAVGYEKLSVNSIRINWTDNSISEDGFRIDKKVGANNWVTGYATVGTDITTWTDTSAEINENILYSISAYKGINSTTTSNSPLIVNTFPAPTSLTYSKLTITSIKVDWQDNSVGEDGFRIDRSVNGVWTNNYVTLPSNTRTYADGFVPVNKTMQYRIYAYKGADQSTTASTSNISNVLPPPSNPVLSQLAVNIVRIDWTDNSTGEDGFKIDRKDETGTWTNDYASLSPDAITWNDSTAVISDSLQYRIYAYKGAENSVYANAFASDLTFPPPTDVQFVKINLNTIDIYWTDNSVGESGYKIDRQVEGNSWEIEIGTVGTDIETWSDSNVPLNSEVQYRVYGFTATDESSYGYSELINNAIPSPVLDLVTQLSVSSFKLDWSDNSNGEDGFKIERKIDDGTYSQIASVEADIITFTDSSLDKKGYTTICYRIKAYKGTDESTYSENTQTISFPAPTDVNYSKVSVNSINLTWTDNSDGEEGFRIDKKVGAFAWVIGFGTVSSNISSWLDLNADPNTTIQYKVYAYNGANTSPFNLSAIIDNTFPAPTNISTEKIDLSSIKLNWTDNSTGETGFIIGRIIGVQSWESYDSTVTNATTWTDVNATTNETLQYRIRAHKDSFISTNLETSAIDNSIPAPTNLSADVNGMSITLNWIDNSTGEDGFKIDRMIGEGVWVENFATVGADIITWNETVLDTGKYYYRVKGYWGTDESAESEVEEVWLQVIISEPSNINYEKISLDSIRLTWNDNSDNEDGFKIDKKIGLNDWVVNYDSTIVNITSWIDESAEVNENIIYRIMAYKDQFSSDYLESVVIDNTFPAPSNLTADVSGMNITLNWTDNSNGEDGFKLDKKVGDGSWVVDYAQVVENIVTWNETVADTGKYYYRVKGYYNIYESQSYKDLEVHIDQITYINVFIDSLAKNIMSIKETSELGYIGVGWKSNGTNSDIWLFKTDLYGTIIWEKTFGGIAILNDRGYDVQETIDGGFILTGMYATTFNTSRLCLIKTNSDGTKEWEKIFASNVYKEHEQGFSVIQSSDGGYAIAGQISIEDGGYYWTDMWLIKTDSNGDMIWDNSFTSDVSRDSNVEAGYSIKQTSDGGYIIVGYTWDGWDGNPQKDVFIIKTDSDGNQAWKKQYGGSGLYIDVGNDVIQTNDGGYFIVGYSNISGTSDGLLLKLNSVGDQVFSKSYGGAGEDIINSISWISDEEFIMVGETNSMGYGGYDAWLIKVDQNGNEIWEKTYFTTENDYGKSIDVTFDKGFIIGGSTMTDVGAALLIKTDENGNVMGLK
ncbi:MAG: fibronectin type III domain-containing protein [Candidatus Delongbacteria bacterium]|jgi:hypothetical protein|nr:fibronectin type III domain-containing protein [Candidatus Delongbacteria bacterium]